MNISTGSGKKNNLSLNNPSTDDLACRLNKNYERF